MKNPILYIILISIFACSQNNKNKDLKKELTKTKIDSQIKDTTKTDITINSEKNNIKNEKAKTETKSLNENNKKLDINYYGKKISDDVIENYPRTKELVMKNGKKNTTISGKIVSTCQKKGCWMKLDTGTDTLFVKFRDYDFFVPISGVDGKSAVINGDLFLDTTSIEMLKHYAEDAGKSKEEISLINQPKYDVNFIADGVIIKN